MTSPTSAEQRDAARFAAELPLELEGMPGVTRDVSTSGIYFETDALREIGPIVSVTLRCQEGGQERLLQCEARVVRVEARGDRIGIAARLMTPFFVESEVVELPH
jgi:hypothetical protein